MEQQLISLLFPEGMLDYFDVISARRATDHYDIFLDEKNIPPKGYKKKEVESKGFHNMESITDFPLRGKRCILRIRRRRWLVKSEGKLINRDWNIVAKGTRTTVEFASFLKELNRQHALKL